MYNYDSCCVEWMMVIAMTDMAQPMFPSWVFYRHGFWSTTVRWYIRVIKIVGSYNYSSINSSALSDIGSTLAESMSFEIRWPWVWIPTSPFTHLISSELILHLQQGNNNYSQSCGEGTMKYNVFKVYRCLAHSKYSINGGYLLDRSWITSLKISLVLCYQYRFLGMPNLLLSLPT